MIDTKGWRIIRYENGGLVGVPINVWVNDHTGDVGIMPVGQTPFGCAHRFQDGKCKDCGAPMPGWEQEAGK